MISPYLKNNNIKFINKIKQNNNKIKVIPQNMTYWQKEYKIQNLV